ncbi:MAG: hypothetical protein ACYTXI_23040 [Nostoc sp.]
MKQLNNTTSERVDDLPVIIHWLSLSSDPVSARPKITNAARQSSEFELRSVSSITGV